MKLGARDPRVLAILLAGLKRSPSVYAALLATYGDPAALLPLYAALAQAEVPVGSEALVASALVEIASAIEQLGGTVGASGKAKLAATEREAAAYRADFIESMGEGLARSAPCWCGSGKKFKRCHGAG